MKKAHFRLIVNATYEREDGADLEQEELEQIKRNLDYIPEHAAGAGLFTVDAFEVVVDTWDSDVDGPKEVSGS